MNCIKLERESGRERSTGSVRKNERGREVERGVDTAGERESRASVLFLQWSERREAHHRTTSGLFSGKNTLSCRFDSCLLFIVGVLCLVMFVREDGDAEAERWREGRCSKQNVPNKPAVLLSHLPTVCWSSFKTSFVCFGCLDELKIHTFASSLRVRVFSLFVSGAFFPSCRLLRTLAQNHDLALSLFVSRVFWFSRIVNISAAVELQPCGTRGPGHFFAFLRYFVSPVCCKMEAGWRRRMLPWPPSASHDLLVHITW